MKTLTLSTLLALSVATYAGVTPSFAQAQSISQSQWQLEEAFKQLSESDRITIQSQLSEFGLYASILDGLWGRNTENALRQAAVMMEQNMGMDLSLHSPQRSREFLNKFLNGSASAFMWGEGGECDGCGENNQKIVASAENTVVLPEGFQCNAQPRVYQAGRLEFGGLRWTQASDQVEALLTSFKHSTEIGRSLDPSEKRQIEKIINTHEIPYAAEFYGYELYNAGDFKGAHEAWAKAALHGEPASAALLTVSLLGEYDEFKHLTFANRPTTEVIVDCLRYAAKGEDENSIMLLASALVGNPDVPDELRGAVEIDTEEARHLLGTLPYNFSTEFADAISGIRKLADAADQKVRAKAATDAAGTAQSFSGKCEGLVSLKGIWWAMAPDEIATVLTSQQYECKRDLFENLYCELGNAEIEFSETQVSFNCEAFDVCQYDHTEVSDFLLRQGVVIAMEENQRLVTQDAGDAALWIGLGGSPALAFDGPYWLNTSCGEGPQGQELCVEQPEDGVFRLVLNKNTYGAATPSFD